MWTLQNVNSEVLSGPILSDEALDDDISDGGAFIKVNSAGGFLGQCLPKRSLSHFKIIFIGSFWHVAKCVSSTNSPLVMLHLETGFRLLLSPFFGRVL